MVMGGVSMGGMVATLTVMRNQEMWQARPVHLLMQIQDQETSSWDWSLTGHLKQQSQLHAYTIRRHPLHLDFTSTCFLLQVWQAVSAVRSCLCRG